LIILDQADFRGGAAHIEGQDLGLAETGRNLRRENRAARRARLDKAHRKALRRLDRSDAATRGHEIDGAAELLDLERLGHACEIAVDERLQIGIGDGG
jgi:hypothetical protein